MANQRIDATPDLNATPSKSSTPAASVGGDGSVIEGSSVSTAIITTAATVGAPALQSSSAGPMSMPRQSPDNHAEIWEGVVTWNGERVCNIALGYSNSHTPEIPPFWSQTMEIVQLLPMDTLNSRCTGDQQMLLFTAKEQHIIFDLMRDNNLYAEIQLPYQTLFLALVHKGEQQNLLIGILLYGHQPNTQQQQLETADLPFRDLPLVRIQHQQVALRQVEQPAGLLQEHQLAVHLQQLQPASQLQRQQQQLLAAFQQYQLLQTQCHQLQKLHETLQLLQHQVRTMEVVQVLVRLDNQKQQLEWLSLLGEVQDELQLLRQAVHQQSDIFQSLPNLQQ